MIIFNINIRKWVGAVVLTTIASLLGACDNISESERYIIHDTITPQRVVLLEDFTGQNCINCPDAHTVIEGLQEQYGDAVIAVSIHGGATAISRERTSFDANYIGLATPEGEYYNSLFNITEWPKGLINRDGGSYDYADWATIVREELKKESELSINLTASVIPDYKNGRLDINVELLPQDDIKGAYLQVWILESGIVARQRSRTNGLISNYVHNNVLRAAVNGSDGEPVELKKGIHNTSSYSVAVRNNEQERWNIQNLAIVAFVRSESGIHQAAIARL